MILNQSNSSVAKHNNSHASSGSDPITPADIGAAPASHASNTTIHVTAAEKDAWNGKAPAYTYGTADLTAGTSALETGKLYFVYE